MINGIKPTITTTTKLNIKPHKWCKSFDEAMDVFCQKLEKDATEYINGFNHIDSVMFRQDGGVKYIKVKYFQTNVETNHETGVKRLVGGDKG